MTRQGEPHDEGYLHVAREVFAQTTKPFCILSNLASAVANDEAALVRDDGIPVLEGTASGLAALRHLLAYRDRARAAAGRSPRSRSPTTSATGGVHGWRPEASSASSRGSRCWPTTASRRRRRVAPSIDEGAIAAAEELGWPVAMKTAAPGVQHKSDVGGVVLGLARRGRAPGGLRGHRVPARSARGRGAHGSSRRRARARHRPRPAVRAARPGGGRRRPGRGPPRPAARVPAARRVAGRAR